MICTRKDTVCEVKNRYFCLSVVKVVVYRNDGHFGVFDHHLNNCCETRKPVNLQLLRSKRHGLKCGLTFQNPSICMVSCSSIPFTNKYIEWISYTMCSCRKFHVMDQVKLTVEVSNSSTWLHLHKTSYCVTEQQTFHYSIFQLNIFHVTCLWLKYVIRSRDLDI